MDIKLWAWLEPIHSRFVDILLSSVCRRGDSSGGAARGAETTLLGARQVVATEHNSPRNWSPLYYNISVAFNIEYETTVTRWLTGLDTGNKPLIYNIVWVHGSHHNMWMALLLSLISTSGKPQSLAWTGLEIALVPCVSRSDCGNIVHIIINQLHKCRLHSCQCTSPSELLSPSGPYQSRVQANECHWHTTNKSTSR